jgi:hypothetical protein
MAGRPIELGSLKDNNPLDPEQKCYDIWNVVLQSDSPTRPAEAAKQIELFTFQDLKHADSSHAESAEIFCGISGRFLFISCNSFLTAIQGRQS